MSEKDENLSIWGVSFTLSLLLALLKLTGQITCSWWIVALPVLLVLAILLMLLFVLVVMTCTFPRRK